jgi:hypothetical protein
MSSNRRYVDGETSISGVGAAVPKELGVGEGLGAGVAGKPGTAKHKHRKATNVLNIRSVVYQNTISLATPKPRILITVAALRRGSHCEEKRARGDSNTRPTD